MSGHLQWDALNEYADGAMAPAERNDAARHLDVCADCRHDLERLRVVLKAAAAAPASIEAPESAWGAIRATIDSEKVRSLPQASRPNRSARAFRLAAAAVLLVVASSTITVMVMRRGLPPATAAIATQGAPAVGSEPLTAGVVRMERGYVRTVNELRAAPDTSRSRLAPETVRAVERSLKVIDDAIVEARTALMRDPASDVLRDALSRNYQQKVDLLRRASAHATE
jgi:hypothetical protein